MKKVLFLCTNNSARSQIAKGILMAKAGDLFEAYSAGTDPTDLHPMAIQVSKEIGIDISRHEVTSVGKYFREPFDWVITVCNRAKEKCPIYPLATWLHWDIEDPTDLASFRRVRDELLRRINAFLKGTYIQDGTWLGGKTISKKRGDE
jgi:arsenate reductase (thioredoxin)